MPVRVEIIDEAVADILRYSRNGNLLLFLKRLVRLEEAEKDAGQPLGGGLTGWRKITVGNRNWRIIFTTNTQDTVATVWVVGDRADAACYPEAQARVAAAGKTQPHAASPAAVMIQLDQLLRSARRE